jgi:hypothetical protein
MKRSVRWCARMAMAAVGAALLLAPSSQAAGATWHAAALPSAAQDWSLQDVAIDISGRSWTAGQQGTRAFVAHNDGSGWTRSYVARATLGSAGSKLSAIATTGGGSEVFAAGAILSAEGTDRSLIVHWAGDGWQRMGSRNRPGATDLYGIAARAPNDVWAVGSSSDDGFQTTSTLIEHWNGVSWRIVRSPNPDQFQNELTHIAAGRNGALFASGHTSTGTLLMRRLRGRWRTVATPAPAGFGSTFLEGLAVGSPHDVWLAGYGQRTSDGASRPLVEHWNGSSWTVYHTPNVPPQSYLSDIAVGGGRVVAVGASFSDFGSSGIVEQFDGTAWSVADTSDSDAAAFAAVASRPMLALAVGTSFAGGGSVEGLTP